MTRTSKKHTKAVKTNPIVDFRYEDIDYQIDPENRRVYRNWVSVETARTFLIVSAWSEIRRQNT